MSLKKNNLATSSIKSISLDLSFKSRNKRKLAPSPLKNLETLELYNQDKKLIKVWENHRRGKILHLDNLSRGTYYLKSFSSNGRASTKMIIKD